MPLSDDAEAIGDPTDTPLPGSVPGAGTGGPRTATPSPAPYPSYERESEIVTKGALDWLAGAPRNIANMPTDVWRTVTGRPLYPPFTFKTPLVEDPMRQFTAGMPTPATPGEALGYAAGQAGASVLPTLAVGNLAGLTGKVLENFPAMTSAVQSIPLLGTAATRAANLATALARYPELQTPTAMAGGVSAQEAANLGLPGWAQLLAGATPGALLGLHPSLSAKTGIEAASDIDLANAARAMGINITPESLTSKVPAILSKLAGYLPGSGAEANVAARFTEWKQALGQLGGLDTITDPNTKFTTKTFDQMGRVIDGEYGSARSYGPDVSLTPGSPLDNALRTIEGNLNPTDPNHAPVQSYINNLRKQVVAGNLSRSDVIDQLASGSKLSKLMNSNPANWDEFESIHDALSDGLNAVSSPEQLQALTDAKYHYKNMMTLQRATDPVTRQITPDSLLSAMNATKRYQQPITTDSDMNTLMQIGKRLIAKPEDTPPAKQIAATASGITAGPMSILAGGEAMRGFEGLPLGDLSGLAAPALATAAAGVPLGAIYSQTGRLGPIPKPGTTLPQAYVPFLLHGPVQTQSGQGGGGSSP